MKNRKKQFQFTLFMFLATFLLAINYTIQAKYPMAILNVMTSSVFLYHVQINYLLMKIEQKS